MADKNLRALWNGFRLYCPRCEQGKIFEGLKRRRTCSVCRVVFERPEQGDFLVTVVFVYATTAVLISLLVFLVNYTVPGLDVTFQIVLFLLLGVGFALATYRNFKGLSVGLMYVTFGLERAEPEEAANENGTRVN